MKEIQREKIGEKVKMLLIIKHKNKKSCLSQIQQSDFSGFKGL